MKTIKQLTKDYQERFNAWVNQTTRGGKKQRGRKKAPIPETPNYVIEVIAPIIIELARCMPDHLVEIPDPETYGIGAGDMYHINIRNRSIGGLTYLNYGESEIHFIPVSSGKISKERLPVSSIQQLEYIVRKQLAILNGRAPIEEIANLEGEEALEANLVESPAKRGKLYSLKHAM